MFFVHFVSNLSAMHKNRTYSPWVTCRYSTFSNLCTKAKNRTYAPRVSCFANVAPMFVAKPRTRTHDTLETMDIDCPLALKMMVLHFCLLTNSFLYYSYRKILVRLVLSYTIDIGKYQSSVYDIFVAATVSTYAS